MCEIIQFPKCQPLVIAYFFVHFQYCSDTTNCQYLAILCRTNNTVPQKFGSSFVSMLNGRRGFKFVTSTDHIYMKLGNEPTQ